MWDARRSWGGSDKSRLVLEAGHSLLPLFADGVFWVAMDTFQTDRNLAPLVCAALDLKLSPTTGSNLQNELIAYLRQKKLLLILDGFESMLPEADLVANLLRGTPQLKILVTSRAQLNIQSEYVFSLGGLDYPADLDDSGDIHQFSALQLFEQAARRSLGNFGLLPANQAAVIEICRLLEGLPLGILLAAKWVNTLSPDQILGEMQRSQDILSTDLRDLPGRQRSLTAIFDYSFSLLPEPEKIAFLRLSVFHSPFTSARAEHVASVSIYSLKRLVDKSILQHSGADRFHMHDMLRQYALEKLAEDPQQDWEVHQKHCQVFLETLSAWEARLKSPHQLAALEEMDLDCADFLAAWDWGLEKYQFIQLEKAIEAFRYYHYLRSLLHEMDVLCQKALTKMGTVGIDEHNLHLWLRLANWQFDCLGDRRDYQQGLDWILQVEEHLRHISYQPTIFSCELALLIIGKALALEKLNGDRALIQQLQERSLELAHACGDPYLICEVMFVGSLLPVSVPQRLKLTQPTLEIGRSIGDPNQIAFILIYLGYAYLMSGDYLNALQILEECNTDRQQWNHYYTETNSILFKRYVFFHSGQYLQSRLEIEEGLRLAELSGNLDFQKYFRLFLDNVFLALGDYEAVLSDQAFAGDGMDEEDRIKSSFDRGCAHLVFQRWDRAEEELTCFQQIYDSGSGIVENLVLVSIGGTQALLGYIAYRRGNLDSARQFLIQALENGLEMGYYMVLCYCLAVVSLMLCEKGDLSDGTELYRVAFAHPAIKNSRFMQDAFGQYIDPLVASPPSEVLQAAQERGLQMNREDAAQEWLQRLRDEPGLLSGFSG